MFIGGRGDWASRWTFELGAPLGCRRESTTIKAHRSHLQPQTPSWACHTAQGWQEDEKIQFLCDSPTQATTKWQRRPSKMAKWQGVANNSSHGGPYTWHTKAHEYSGSSTWASSPSTRSPTKSKPRMDSSARLQEDIAMEVSGPKNTHNAQHTYMSDPIADFPTSDKPIPDTILKEMLLSLRSSLQADMVKGINKCQREVQAIRSRVDHVEQKMDIHPYTTRW